MIIDVQPKELGIPTKAYYAVEEVKEVSDRDLRSGSCSTAVMYSSHWDFIFIYF